MTPSESIGSRFVGGSKRFAQKYPVVSFILAVLGVAFVALLLVLMVHRPFRYKGKSLGEWKTQLALKEFEGLAYEEWIGGNIFYQNHLQELFARSGDEGVLYLLGCAQFHESAVFAWLDKLPGNLRKLIPVKAPALQKQSRTRALALLAGLESDLLRHPRILEYFRTIALAREKDSNAAATVWFVHHPDKQVALDALLETYLDQDENQLLRLMFYLMKQRGIRCTLPDDIASRWLKEGEDVNNFFNASFLYQYSSDFFPVFRDALSDFISNMQMKSSVMYPLASLRELHDMEIPASEKVELFELVWREAESPLLKASAAIGMARLDGEISPWWTKARNQVKNFPEVCNFQSFAQLEMVLQLFPDNQVLKQRLELELFQGKTHLHPQMQHLLAKYGVRHEQLISALETSLHNRDGQVIWALRSLLYLEKLTDTMKISIARLKDFPDPEVRRLALELSERFEGVSGDLPADIEGPLHEVF